MDAFQIITLAFLIINLSFLISSIAHTLLSKDKEEPNPRVSIAPSVLSTQSCRSQHSLQPQLLPATLRMSSNRLVQGRPTLLFPKRSLHSRTRLP
ncbi:uncharacterized protein LOC126368812 isoform X2 [Pectinophora gossypiella]|uniref:uncharacterized protein LOC126368812 isoform X2 n=1 Tax=Pectinophora gossypiella TaxID=13191 RepID=UPI00214EC3D9|nr:uncharacterized protein LOC126368812 isoform X2 [Pectinophora gossypiella]